ncbi:BfmA/BtgA family mobilization protein [uncultured Christiangramia sp.]|uniref:BfmA/BtgA family mobilization protein n=1 Tax=Christiangramia sp. 3-2217-3z TaxID=3417564 RepID=UPI00260B59B4|nr:BfmA/BtgA family mobilization protein [uncultured Christiangramia sp.]
MAKKSILISTYHHKELAKLSDAFGFSYYKLVEEMITYFKKTGINPLDSKNENPSMALKTLDKRLISFIKIQERDILKPLRQEVYDYSQEQKQEIQKSYKILVEELSRIDHHERERANTTLAEIKKQRKAVIAIAQLIDAKNKSGILSKINNIFD